jgi:small ligand-binding sensory domain FIST
VSGDPAAPFRVAHAGGTEAHWADLTRRCIADLGKIEAATKGGLGFIYVTDHLSAHLGDIIDQLRLMTGIAAWVGTTGIGIIGHAGRGTEPVEYFDVPALAVMLAPLEADMFRLFEQQESGTSAFSKQHGRWIESHGALLGLAHADPRGQNLPTLLQNLSEASGLYLVGGLASSRAGHPVAAERVGEGGLGGVIFAGAVGVATGLSQGCAPIGPVHRITEGEHNIIMAIDGRPALDVFKEEIGEVLARNLNRAAGYIFAALPVQGSDQVDYLVRNLVGIDPNKGWIAIGDLVEAGDPILFTRRDKPSAEADLDRMLERLKSRAPAPRGGVYVSCVSRGPNMFGAEAAETRRILDRIGDVPLVGFFANGEISHHRLYGHTGVLTLFT